MPAYLHNIETLVPDFVHRQTEVEKLFLSRIEDRRTRLLLTRALRGSGIETRHSVCPGFFSNEIFDDRARASTGKRNAVYLRESRQLASSLGKTILGRSPTMEPGDITHVIYASCTGFANPGPDYFLIEDLGLSPRVQRYVLGSMGCYSAIPALRLAGQICHSTPEANVLLICLDLCSLHLHLEPTHDAILATSLFGDGAGAALLSAREPEPLAKEAALLGDFHTDLIPEGEPDMAWRMGDEGFDLVLSRRVPDLIENRIGDIVRGLVSPEDIDHWAVHPGGKSILDGVEREIPLPAEKLAVSRSVMRRYGNMAGATVLFVLKEILGQAQPGESILSIAFGPGLTVEAGRLTRFPS